MTDSRLCQLGLTPASLTTLIDKCNVNQAVTIIGPHPASLIHQINVKLTITHPVLLSIKPA